MSDNKKTLPEITLVAISSVHLYETVRALLYSMRGIEYGDVLLLSHHKPRYLPKKIRFERIGELKNIDDYSHFCIYELGKHIRTDYALIVHHDGFVVNPSSWQDGFLQYDYIGSPWPLPKDGVRYRDALGNIVRVGNGVSLRSKRLMDFPKKAGIPWEKTQSGDYNEDCFLCCKNKVLLEENGMRFAPLDVAVHFGREHTIPENEGIEPFLFHQWRGENRKYPHFRNIPEKMGKKIKKTVWNLAGKMGFSMNDERWGNLVQAFRYLIVGAYNMLLSYCVYALFLVMGCNYILCNAISFCFSVLNSFLCSQKFVFHGENKWYVMLAKVALSYVGTGLILQSILLFLWVDLLNISAFLAPLLNIIIITPLNFVIQKFWAYK